MSSVQNLRELINERLTAAAEEIFTEFEKTIVQYEEEIDRQRRLLDNMWKAEIKFHTTDLLQQPVREENVFAEQNLCNQERNSSLKQKDPEPPQMKEEQEELCTTQEGEQLVLMQAADVLAEGKSKCEEISRKIFEVSDKPLDQLDEEIDYQYRALSITLKPRITLHRVDHPQQHVCKENFIVDQEDPNPSQIKEEQEEFHTSIDQKEPETPKIIKEQEEFRTSLDEQYPESPRFKEEQEEFHTSLDQEDSEPPQINEEQEKLFTSQQGKQNVLKQVTDTFLLTSTEKDGDFSELETNSEQLLSSNSLVAESPHEEGSKHADSGSTRNAALKAKKSCNRKSSHSNNADKTSLSESHCDTDTGHRMTSNNSSDQLSGS
ncbi:golgin subfamily A member 6-like protein 22 isoform X50 [Acanthochromis polyacanthus]|uniref:golgin subfamily A member 6-like protein 22 isoform X50 n=1 Tax=Acanthochromis polyacanthus TaxID=80966 RepID=UPI002234E533|nr:golgin subfamily A member 6-like protein 22 isoform X50 [Acanthochromis polyacanthus]